MKEICRLCKLGPCRIDQKRCEGLDEELMDLAGGATTDWYPESTVKRGEVSIEGAALDEFENKDAIDDAVEHENIYSSSAGKVGNKGVPVCMWRKKQTNG